LATRNSAEVKFSRRWLDERLPHLRAHVETYPNAILAPKMQPFSLLCFTLDATRRHHAAIVR